MNAYKSRGAGLWLAAGLAIGACKEEGPGPTQMDTGDGSSGINVDTGSQKLDLGGGADTTDGMDPIGCSNSEGGCSNLLDLLFVIDNSGSMGEEQLNLARNLPGLVKALEELVDANGNPVNADVNIMVTTTDSGNVLCEMFYHPGRGPEMGEPIDTPCTDRLERFTNFQMTVEQEQACTNVCPNPVGPDAPFIHFNMSSSNVMAEAADVDGDGEPDSAAAQALACIGPQGIDGCGYESQLESMMRALDPDAPWNSGSTPFLRNGGLLAVAIITDEADCSVIDDAVMTDPAFISDHPTAGPTASSAICWNAGVTCEGPDAEGVYASCESKGTQLRPVQEYVDFLQGQGRPVVMLGIIGIPLVTERNPEPPFEPLAGGVLDLVYRDWQDPEFPAGDILPDDWDAGRDAAFQTWQYGIGPGCTGQDTDGNFTGQAIPPVRVKEVCQALDTGDEIRCCMESICDTDFRPALRCLAGLVQENLVPVE